MKERKKSLKTLLEGDFRPLGESKEGKLRGGFGVLDSNTNCGPNCSCTNNSTCPPMRIVLAQKMKTVVLIVVAQITPVVPVMIVVPVVEQPHLHLHNQMLLALA